MQTQTGFQQEAESANAPKELTDEEENNLEAIITGRLRLSDPRLQETAREAMVLRNSIESNKRAIEKSRAVLKQLENDSIFKEGAYRKCRADLIRWALPDVAEPKKGNGELGEPEVLASPRPQVVKPKAARKTAK